MIIFGKFGKEIFFIFLWAYMVSSIYACVNVVKMHIILHPPKGAKHLFPKQECPKKGHQHECFRVFGPFLAKIVDCIPPKGQNLFSENKNAPKRDMRCPEIIMLHPPKRAKHLSWKQECPKKGHVMPWNNNVASPQNGKPFKLKTRMPQKETISICQNVNNIWQIYWNHSEIMVKS